MSPAKIAELVSEQIYLKLLSQANTKVQDRYIFGGFATAAQPFAAGANRVDCLADNGQVSIASSPTSSPPTNLLENHVFQGVGVTNGVGVLDTLRDLETVLQDTLQTQTEAEQSSVEDADSFTAYAEFAGLQQAFQAAVGSAARIIQPSLLDFLQ